MEQAQFIKLKCAKCGYEQISQAKKPRCYKCRSRKLNSISELTIEKIPRGEKMPEQTKEAKKPQEEKEKTEEEWDMDKEVLGDDDEDEE